MNNLLHSFTTNLRRVLVQAAQLAASEGKKRIEPVHLFHGLTNHAETTVTNISSLATATKQSKKKQPKKIPVSLVLSPVSKKIILDAATIAGHYNHDHIGTEHLFVSLLESSHPSVKKLIQVHNIDSRKVKQQLGMILKSSSKIFDILETLLPPGDHTDHGDDHQPPQEQKTTSPRQRKVTALEYFAVHLTDPHLAHDLDPLIGREKEIERLIRILARRTKNNPILLGLPGVGKTAIVEGLAKRISTGEVPEFFRNKKIFSLNLTALVAGSAFRGELEMRFKQVIDEVKNDPNIILFIDEIHNLVGAGSSNGSLDAANILKPALARGELRCVGATTFSEYKKYIEEDPALERRFQPIIVEQPSLLEAERILKGLIPYYEKYHNVVITAEAVTAAVQLSHRYITEKCLPDKAIDLIDEAAAKTKLESRTTELYQSLAKLQQQVDEISTEKEKTLYQLNDVVRAHELHQQEMHLKSMVADLQKTIELRENEPTGTIMAHTIAEIVASVTGIPVTSLVASEKERLLKLEERLSQSIIGQEEAKKAVSNYIRRAKSGLINRGRPMASFAFLGPSGVGKTELAKTLAEEIFGKDGLIKLDMSEFSESFTISRLIGAPSGYIGYKEGGRLTEAVRQKPHSLIVFDEIEKAHPRLFNVLLQILEDGCLTDAAGKRVDFSNTIIILTSNIGAKKFLTNPHIGFGAEQGTTAQERKTLVLDELKDIFNPELINRLDQIIVFDPLEKTHIEKIVDIQLKKLEEKIQEQKLTLSISNDAKEALVTLAYDPAAGGRQVRHVIERELENRIAELLLSNEIPSSATISIDTRDNELIARLQ